MFLRPRASYRRRIKADYWGDHVELVEAAEAARLAEELVLETAREGCLAMDRSEVPALVSTLVALRPVRWAPHELAVGDYDGRERTLEIFNAAAPDQLKLLRELRAVRAELAQAAGGPVVFIFHTPQESQRLYTEFLAKYPPIEAEVGPLRAGGSLDQPVKVDEARPHRRAA
jgi:hypothetical protein